MGDRKAVYTVRERGEGKKAFWARIGTCFTNRDGSFSVVLDANPIDGRLVIRDEEQRDTPRDEPARRQAPQGRGRQQDFGGDRDDNDIPF